METAPLLEEVVTNQGKSELANQGRHNIGETKADHRRDHIANQISNKAWMVIGVILGATLIVGGNSIRMHYSWLSDFDEARKMNAELVARYHDDHREREGVLLRELQVSQIESGNLLEENMILKSHFTGQANFLEDSRVINIYRDDIFEFVNWKNPDFVVRKFCEDNKSELVEWVREQPNWESCLNPETVNMVNNYNENNVLHVAMKNIRARTLEERAQLRLEYDNWVKNND